MKCSSKDCICISKNIPFSFNRNFTIYIKRGLFIIGGLINIQLYAYIQNGLKNILYLLNENRK